MTPGRLQQRRDGLLRGAERLGGGGHRGRPLLQDRLGQEGRRAALEEAKGGRRLALAKGTVGIGYCDYHLVTLVSVLIGNCDYLSNS